MVHILGFTPIYFFFHLVNSITSHICGSIYANRIELTIIYAIEMRSYDEVGGDIKIMKKLARYLIHSIDNLIRLRNYCFTFAAMIIFITASSKAGINHRTYFEGDL